MQDRNKNPRRSGGWGDRLWAILGIGAVGIGPTHVLDHLSLLFDAIKETALDLNQRVRIAFGNFRLMAGKGFSGLAVGDGDVLMSNITAPVVTLEIRGMFGPGIQPGGCVRLLDFHKDSLLVRRLVALAVVAVLVGIVALTVATKQMRMTLIVVGIFAGMLDAGANALPLGHFVMDMMEMGAQMPFLGMGIKNLLLAFHLVNVFAQDFAMGTIGKCLGGDDHRRLSEGGMAWGLNGAGANSLMVLDLQDFGNASHWYHLSWVARKRANSADHRHTFMIQSFQGAASV